MPTQQSHQSSRSTTTQYASWFDTIINDFAARNQPHDQTSTSFKGSNGFFITVSFDQNTRHVEGRKAELERFSDLYNVICRQVVDRNFHRPAFADSLPLAIAGLDANGSRYWRTMGSPENLHIHSIWIFTPSTIEKFRRWIADDKRLQAVKERFGIRALDIQPLDDRDRNSQGVSQVLSYTAKFIGHNNARLEIGDDFRVYPADSRGHL